MKGFIFLTLFLANSTSWAYGIGYSAYPLQANKKIVSAEFTGITSQGGGVGMQARYTHKLNESLSVDAGLGFGGGMLTGRIFVGADFLLFPDHQKQPRISLKGVVEHAQEFFFKRNVFTIAPVVSKGLSFWGYEGHPFVSIPLGIGLNTGYENTYETVMSLNTGITAPIPFEGYRHFMANIEAIINLKDSFTGVFAGVSYPLQ